MSDPNTIYSVILLETLGDRLHPHANSYVEKVAEHGVVELPMPFRACRSASSALGQVT